MQSISKLWAKLGHILGKRCHLTTVPSFFLPINEHLKSNIFLSDVMVFVTWLLERETLYRSLQMEKSLLWTPLRKMASIGQYSLQRKKVLEWSYQRVISLSWMWSDVLVCVILCVHETQLIPLCILYYSFAVPVALTGNYNYKSRTLTFQLFKNSNLSHS